MQTTLQLNISEDLVQMFGISALQTYMQKRLEMLKLQLLADKIGFAIAESDMDWELELENARKEAWNEHKQQNINK
jgi:hypothetical protein